MNGRVGCAALGTLLVKQAAVVATSAYPHRGLARHPETLACWARDIRDRPIVDKGILCVKDEPEKQARYFELGETYFRLASQNVLRCWWPSSSD